MQGTVLIDPNKHRIAKIDGMKKAALDGIQALFTDDQKKTWKDMTGEPFEIRIERRAN